MFRKDLDKRINGNPVVVEDKENSRLVGQQHAIDGHLKVLGGTASKTFHAIDDNEKRRPIDSEFFYKLFRELAHDNCSYKTYLNNDIKDFIKENYIPRYIYGIVSDVRVIRGIRTELGQAVGPVLANMFNIPTVYNVAVPIDDEYSDFDNYPKYKYIFSVDATPSGYIFEDMRSVFIESGEHEPNFDIMAQESNLGNIIERIKYGLTLIQDKYSLNLTTENVNRYIESFITQYLFKKVWCGDSDFVGKNIPIMIGQDEDSKLYNPHYGEEKSCVGDFFCGPMFDYECLFDFGCVVDRDAMTRDAFEYCYNNGYGNLADDFMSKVDKYYNSGAVQDILMNTIKLPPHVIKNAGRLLHANTQRMMSEWQKFKKSTPEA